MRSQALRASARLTLTAALLALAACDADSRPADASTDARDAGLATDAPVADGGDDDAGADARDAGPPPAPPPADDDRAVHAIVERNGALWVARIVPAAGYVGPVGDALPVLPTELEEVAMGEPPPLWSRDEGPRAVVDLGPLGVFVGEGGAWTKLGDVPTDTTMTTVRSLQVSPQVDRVLLGYWVLAPEGGHYLLGGNLWSTAGSVVHEVEPFSTWVRALGVFSSDGASMAVQEPGGIAIRPTADSSTGTLVPGNDDVLAVFATSLILGSPDFPRWFDLSGAELQPEGLALGTWELLELRGAPHAVVGDRLHRLGDRTHDELFVLADGVSRSSVLGYVEGEHLLALSLTHSGDAGFGTRSYVLQAPDGSLLHTFEPAASVVEEEGGITGGEWERRPIAGAWHVDRERVAVIFETRHTHFRGAFGDTVALSEDLWLVDAQGVRNHRLAQHPPLDGSGALPTLNRRWHFTGDGEHLVWHDGDTLHALALDTLEEVALREAF